LERLTKDELAAHAEHVAVFARVSPEHKLRIVEAHQGAGRVVAMTGDGVNDAPALKQADIGVAMGVTGTDVSKQAANMILAKEDLSTIVAAVEEGRVVYENIRKFVRYLLTANLGEILILFVAIIAGWPLPLLPVQLLWINLVTDGLPAVAMAFEGAERGTMKLPPRRREVHILSGGLWQSIIATSGLMALVCLGLYFYDLRQSADAQESAVTHARTMVLLAASMFQLFLVLAVRSRTESFFTARGLWGNYRLSIAVVVGMRLQWPIIYWPPVAQWFHPVPLAGADAALAIALSTTGFIAVEVMKCVRFSRTSA
jgi:Ca2+-transporting ATPase